MFDPEVLEEFKAEAEEMLNDSEDFLLAMEKDDQFEASFNGVFRAFHSLKGAAGMFEIDYLQTFMHTIESQFETLKPKGQAQQAEVDYFLQAVDAARNMITKGFSDFSTDNFYKITGKVSEEVVEKPTEPLEQKQKVEARKKEKEKKKKGLVYIVDDEEMIASGLADIFEDHDFQTKIFTNPEVCYEEIKVKEPDLLCSDLKMPQMTGMQLLEKLRADKIKCPVIFITAFMDNTLLTDGLKNGASGFLEKPFEVYQVVSLATEAVKRHQIRTLLNRSISYILYQYNDLDNYLKKEGKEILRKNLKSELDNLLTLKKELTS